MRSASFRAIAAPCWVTLELHASTSITTLLRAVSACWQPHPWTPSATEKAVSMPFCALTVDTHRVWDAPVGPVPVTYLPLHSGHFFAWAATNFAAASAEEKLITDSKTS